MRARRHAFLEDLRSALASMLRAVLAAAAGRLEAITRKAWIGAKASIRVDHGPHPSVRDVARNKDKRTIRRPVCAPCAARQGALGQTGGVQSLVKALLPTCISLPWKHHDVKVESAGGDASMCSRS